jgi:hypothetical protein
MARKGTKDALGKVIPPDYTIPVAKVPKITPVKEGQEHPVGKHGQYKLFHEHVWPKGYTPERLKQVNDAQFNVTATGFYPSTGDNSRAINNKIGTSIVNDNIARSTIPIDEVKTLADNTSFYIGKNTPYPTMNSYSPSGQVINMALNEDTTAGDIQGIATHELGHALDYATEPQNMVEASREERDNPELFTYQTDYMTHPVVEGIAEGYRLAHSRVTRGQKRNNTDWTSYGYDARNWKDPAQGLRFLNKRNETFKKATGKDLDEPVPMGFPKDWPSRKPEQLKLFDDL